MLLSRTEDVEGAVPFPSFLVKLSQYTRNLLWLNLVCLRSRHLMPYCLAITGGGSHWSSVVNSGLELLSVRAGSAVCVLLVVGLSVEEVLVMEASGHPVREELGIGIARGSCGREEAGGHLVRAGGIRSKAEAKVVEDERRSDWDQKTLGISIFHPYARTKAYQDQRPEAILSSRTQASAPNLAVASNIGGRRRR